MASPLVYCPGEPAGIGPDIIITLAQQFPLNDVVTLADPDLLLQRAKILRLPLKLVDAKTPVTQRATLRIVAATLPAEVSCGQPNPQNADYLLNSLSKAVRGCQEGHYRALITGPLHKGVINQGGTPFTGHTEYLAELCASTEVVMMLAAPYHNPLAPPQRQTLRVPLITTHLPLREVPQAVTASRLEARLTIILQSLKQQFQLKAPEIAVCGLNPHAGEDGHLGQEEDIIIKPVLDKLRQQGWQIIGPLPADTAFTPKQLARCDAVVAMYHDQGLPVLKHIGFNHGVNITLGLPIVRTSVDHGTALPLAGTGRADYGSLNYALKVAREMTSALIHDDIS
ncbi:MAG: 4-hydroxythreonine-4-phosphate dehydrogenase PdxA [Gammaproteobacteria bacterium]|nr:4-hydroxythreonine-4-phosphate dehydrogenase PdxA [Gammaproteobacteria bacterium]